MQSTEELAMAEQRTIAELNQRIRNHNI